MINWIICFFRYLEEWIDDYPSRISRSETETVIKRAFDMWAEVTPLTLTQTRNYNADIHIRFIEWCIYLQICLMSKNVLSLHEWNYIIWIPVMNNKSITIDSLWSLICLFQFLNRIQPVFLFIVPKSLCKHQYFQTTHLWQTSLKSLNTHILQRYIIIIW